MIVSDSFVGMDSGTLNEVSDSVDLKGSPLFSWWAKKKSGTIASCVITLQCSPDGTNWFDTANTLTFGDENDQSDTNITMGAQFIRAKITTKSALASTVDVFINAK